MTENCKTLSFEFFPPNTDSTMLTLIDLAKEFESIPAKYFSITFSGRGSAQKETFNTVESLSNSTKIPIAPTISGIGLDSDLIQSILSKYKERGIKKILVFRGDLPPRSQKIGDFTYAVNLLDFIFEKFGNYFEIEVGAYPEMHPEAANSNEDIEYFCEKMSRDVKGAITQFFFKPEAYFDFIDKCANLGCTKPITPGVLPFSSKKELEIMSKKCGVELPKVLIEDINEYKDERDVKKFGEMYITSLVQELLDNGVPGIHFYTLNKLEPTKNIINLLN